MTGFNPRNSTRYTGTDVWLANIVTRNRRPTGADYRQPETGRNYVIFAGWQVSKDPTTGAEGELWLLSKIVANVAYWVQISGAGIGGVLTLSDTANTLVYPLLGNIKLSGTAGQIDVTAGANELVFSLPGGGGAVDSFTVDAVTVPGVNPVTPTVLGVVTVGGSTVAAHSVPVETQSLALNEYNVAVQVAKTVTGAPADASDTGLAVFESTKFAVNANGYVTLSGTGVGQTITGNTGGALPPTAGNWNIIGIGETTTSGAGSTLSILEPRNNHIIVDPTQYYGTHQTIAAAVTAASAGDVIFIRPGIYTENLTIAKNLTFFAYGGKNRYEENYAVEIVGKITIATNNTIIGFSNIKFTANGNNIAQITSTDTKITFNGCFIDYTDQTAFVTSGNLNNIHLNSCYATCIANGRLFTMTNVGTFWIQESQIIDITSPLTSTHDTGSVFIQGSRVNVPIQCTTSGLIDIQNSFMGSNVTPYTDRQYVSSTGAAAIYIANSNICSGTQAGLSVGATGIAYVTNSEFNSSAVNVLTGAGTLYYGGIVFTGASVGHNVTTETAFTVFG